MWGGGEGGRGGGGTGCGVARPRPNVAGSPPLSDSSYRRMLGRWLATCEIRDEHGRPAHLTPHQWRHTFACRLINRDVPQEVVRVLLDHESHRMTSHYAKITDQTVRRRSEQATQDNTHAVVKPAGPGAEKTRERARAEPRPMAPAGQRIPSDALARQAGAPRSWPYTQAPLPAEIGRLRPRHHPASPRQPVPDCQRAS